MKEGQQPVRQKRDVTARRDDARTRGLVSERGSVCELCDRYRPRPGIPPRPHSSVLAVPAAGADFAVPSSPVAGAPSPPRVFSEATTVARAQDGDTDAFEQLVRSYEADLFRLGFRMLSDRGEAQDAVQDTFVLAWRRLPSLLDPEAFRAWIYQLMTRRCLNILRVRVRRHTGVTSGPDFELEARPAGPAARSTTDPAAAPKPTPCKTA